MQVAYSFVPARFVNHTLVNPPDMCLIQIKRIEV